MSDLVQALCHINSYQKYQNFRFRVLDMSVLLFKAHFKYRIRKCSQPYIKPISPKCLHQKNQKSSFQNLKVKIGITKAETA